MGAPCKLFPIFEIIILALSHHFQNIEKEMLLFLSIAILWPLFMITFFFQWLLTLFES